MHHVSLFLLFFLDMKILSDPEVVVEDISALRRYLCTSEQVILILFINTHTHTHTHIYIYIYIYIYTGAGHINRISSKSLFISLIPFKR